ncbi:MAG TPA: uroporphyrinogen decarboxylase family protein [Tepidisphaeraceae bacterium]|nr:uroporphyrinogen decarboxylase family protein [Tepidisphaeraceae bacterium]
MAHVCVSLPQRSELPPQEQFAEHNAEQKAVWQAFRAGKPTRVPMVIASNVRIILQNPKLNPQRVTFEQYTLDPDLMLAVEILHGIHHRHHIQADHEMGLPQDGWYPWVDFQNMYEAAWLGAPISFSPDNCPYAEIWLKDDNRNEIFDRGIPDPFQDGGWMQRNWDYYGHFCQLRDKGVEFLGLPLKNPRPSGLGTDGPFTLAAELRGGEICVDMLAEPEYFHKLMDFLTQATITRMKAYRQRLGIPERADDFGYADDSVAMLSVEQYRQFVIPYHKRIIEAFWTGKGRLGIHLCGDVQRHLPMLHRELGIRSFDTGFPIDLHEGRRQTSPDTILQGGPTVQLLQNGPIGKIREVCRGLLTGPAAREGLFVLREANNLAPRTPAEHIAAMYEACREYGGY